MLRVVNGGCVDFVRRSGTTRTVRCTARGCFVRVANLTGSRKRRTPVNPLWFATLYLLRYYADVPKGCSGAIKFFDPRAAPLDNPVCWHQFSFSFGFSLCIDDIYGL